MSIQIGNRDSGAGFCALDFDIIYGVRKVLKIPCKDLGNVRIYAALFIVFFRCTLVREKLTDGQVFFNGLFIRVF